MKKKKKYLLLGALIKHLISARYCCLGICITKFHPPLSLPSRLDAIVSDIDWVILSLLCLSHYLDCKHPHLYANTTGEIRPPPLTLACS